MYDLKTLIPAEPFAVGPPHPILQCEGRDYSGADPEIQFPRDWIVSAGQKVLPGRFYQVCDGDGFQPDRARVVMRETPFGPNTPAVRLVCGVPGRPGTAECLRWFEAAKWEPGRVVRAQLRFLVSSESDVRFFNNIELRGSLSFVPYAERRCLISINLKQNGILLYWWKDNQDGDKLDVRPRAFLPVVIAPNIWYKLVIRACATENPNEWDITVRLREGLRVVMRFNTNVQGSPNQCRWIDSLFFGDERDLDEVGGVWYYAEASAFTFKTLPDEAEED